MADSKNLFFMINNLSSIDHRCHDLWVAENRYSFLLRYR